MDVIYSRNKIKIKKKSLVIIIILIIIILLGVFIKYIAYPIFDSTCRNKAKLLATELANTETDLTMQKYEYEDLVKIEKDNNGNIQLIDINIFVLNEIVDEVTDAMRKQILNTNSHEASINIRLGALTGNRLFSGIGPNINLKIDHVGNFSNNLKSEFYSVGVNQSIHRIYLELGCDISITTPINNIEERVENEILLIESIIVGDTPDNYYEIESLEPEDQVEIVK